MNDIQEKIFSEYLKELTTQRRSIKDVKFSLRLFFKYVSEFGIDILFLTVRDAQNFQVFLSTATRADGSIRYAKVSVLTSIGMVTSFYGYLKKRNQIIANPFKEIQRVKRSKSLPRNIFDEKRMDKFLRHLRDFLKGENLMERKNLYKAHVLSELMYSTGARINEVMRLTPEDIDFASGIVKVTDSKTGRQRDCILNEYALRVLKIFVDDMRSYILFGKNGSDTNLLFGSMISIKSWLNDILNKESKRLKFGRFTSHNFRHAVGFHLLRARCDIRYIQEILGHKKLSTTQIYTKVDKIDLKRVIDEFHPRNIFFSNDEIER